MGSCPRLKAPKGLNILAQGNALGMKEKHNVFRPVRARHNPKTKRENMSRPFRAEIIILI